MKHRVWWDEQHGCARMCLSGEYTAQDAELSIDQVQDIMRDRPTRLLLIDHTHSPHSLSAATREVLERRGQSIDYQRLAFYGMTNLNRMIARIVVALLRRADKTQFFASEAEALAWLRGS